MTASARPTRAVVLGNSCGLQVCTRDLRLGHLPYSELLREHLTTASGAAEVFNESTWLGTVRSAVREWPRTVWARWPDLVVIHQGINEARSRLIPPFVHRLAWTFDRTDTRIEGRLVGHLHGAWPRMTRLAARYDRAFIPAHMSVRRYGEQLERLVSQTVVHTNAVCVVIDLNPVNDLLLRSAGGAYATRRDRLQREIERVAASRAGVGVVSLEDVQQELGSSKEAFPDGIHLSPLGHEAVARRIGELYRTLRPSRDRDDSRGGSPPGSRAVGTVET